MKEQQRRLVEILFAELRAIQREYLDARNEADAIKRQVAQSKRRLHDSLGELDALVVEGK
jgi:hypothetical protein